MLTVDSVNFHPFAERLGINILEMDNKTAAVIVDNEFESSYILDEPVNLNSLTKFIYLFHHGGLNRKTRSNSVKLRYTHSFDTHEFLNNKKKEKTVRKSDLTRKSCDRDEKVERKQHIIIREINSDDFEKEVVQSNKVQCDENIDDFIDEYIINFYSSFHRRL